MSLLNVNSGLTYQQEQWLSLLEDWTTTESILSAIISAGLADQAGIKMLALRIGYTRNGGTKSQFLGEIEAAQYVLGFLCTPTVRRAIGRHLQKTYDIPIRKAMKDLREIGVSIVKELHAARVGGPDLSLAVEDGTSPSSGADTGPTNEVMH